jgi:hypothetical protein
MIKIIFIVILQYYLLNNIISCAEIRIGSDNNAPSIVRYGNTLSIENTDSLIVDGQVVGGESLDDLCNNPDDRIGMSHSNPGFSCLDILLTDNSFVNHDGIYWIDPLATGTAFQAFCDMTTNGGGFTLISQRVVHEGVYPWDSSRCGTLDLNSYVLSSPMAKLSDDEINALWTANITVPFTEVLMKGYQDWIHYPYIGGWDRYTDIASAKLPAGYVYTCQTHNHNPGLELYDMLVTVFMEDGVQLENPKHYEVTQYGYASDWVSVYRNAGDEPYSSLGLSSKYFITSYDNHGSIQCSGDPSRSASPDAPQLNGRNYPWARANSGCNLQKAFVR